MLLRHGLRSDDANQYFHGQPVDRVEVDAGGADGNCGSKLRDAVEAAMRDGNPATDARAREPLAFAENVIEDFFVDLCLWHREQRSDRAQGRVLVTERQANPDTFRMKEVSEHDGQAIH